MGCDGADAKGHAQHKRSVERIQGSNVDLILSSCSFQVPGTQNNAQNVNVKTNVSQGGAPQHQGAGLGEATGATVTHHHYHTHNHAGGREVLTAMGLGDQVPTTRIIGAALQ